MSVFRLLMLAWRNLWRNRRRTIITLSTIALGFAMAVISIGLGDGAHNNMIRNGIRMGEGHLTIQPSGYQESPANYLFLENGIALMDRVSALPDFEGRVLPRIDLQLLVASANNSLGAGFKGIDPTLDPLGQMLGKGLLSGQWLKAGDQRGILIGRIMADRLKAKVGTRLVLMSGTRAGDVESRLARVRGIFSSGVDELDGFLALGDLSLARGFLEAEGAVPDGGAVTRLALFLTKGDSPVLWRDRIISLPLPPEVVALDWQQMMPQLVNFILLDDAGNYIWLSFVLIMVASGILNTILMSVLERTREFGLLRALGLRPALLLRLVLMETVLLAVLALLIGWGLAGLLHWYFATQGLDLSGLYPDGQQVMGVVLDPVMKSELSPNRIATLTGVVLGTTLLAGVYPAIRAARITPVAALRT